MNALPLNVSADDVSLKLRENLTAVTKAWETYVATQSELQARLDGWAYGTRIGI